MKLNLIRPICFLDIESTGTDRDKDRIIELSICKLHPSGDRVIKTKRFNPEMPIPAEATRVHGISDADVANEPTFRQVANGILSFISLCDLGGFNSNAFDIPLLYNEFARAGINMPYKEIRFIDAGNIMKINEPRTLSAAVKMYTGKDHDRAHGAEADVLATVDVFMEQCERYDLPGDMDELHLYCNYDRAIVDISGKFCADSDGNILFNFGKNKGVLAKSDPGFLEWMVYKANFAPDTTEVANRLLNEIYEGNHAKL